MLEKKEFRLQFTKQQEEDYGKILQAIRSQLEEDGFHIEKEWWPEGYLLENDHKMWHLELKECPDWLFGVWLDDKAEYKDEYKDEENYELRIFAQHKKYINKFKPTDCMVVNSYDIWKEGISEGFCDWEKEEWVKIFKFVKKQPYLAWYRNAHYIDYNVEYISPEIAKMDFEGTEKDRVKHGKSLGERS